MLGEDPKAEVTFNQCCKPILIWFEYVAYASDWSNMMEEPDLLKKIQPYEPLTGEVVWPKDVFPHKSKFSFFLEPRRSSLVKFR